MGDSVRLEIAHIIKPNPHMKAFSVEKTRLV